MTTPAEPFAGKQADLKCPNCQSPLFSGLAEGILICRDADGNGCQMAVDPDHLEGQTAAPRPVAPTEDLTPQVGPGPGNPDQAVIPEYLQETIAAPWEVPVSAPQAQNAGGEEVVAAPEPAAAPAWSGGTSTGGDSDPGDTHTQ